jgi:sulfate adenylyltransferase subunit 1
MGDYYTIHNLDYRQTGSKKKQQAKKDDYLDFLCCHGWFGTRENKESMYIYFFYQESYIIADMPGHVEYTRNMVTGASTASIDHFD